MLGLRTVSAPAFYFCGNFGTELMKNKIEAFGHQPRRLDFVYPAIPVTAD